MTDIPNSYEELEELIKQKKRKSRPSLIKTIFLPLISAICIFIIWILYPVSAPDFPLRSLLPAASAFSIELHDPQKIIRHLKKNNYIPQVEKLPVWRSLQREYKSATGGNLQHATAEIFQELNSKAEDFFGIRNIITMAVGISYNSQQQEILNGIIWLDNAGYLIFKAAAALSGARETISGIRYYQLPLNTTETLYVSTHPKYPKAIIVSTDLLMLAKFSNTPDNYTASASNTTAENILLRGSIFPAKIPGQNFFTDSAEFVNTLNFSWSDSRLTMAGKLKIAEEPAKMLQFDNRKHLNINSKSPGFVLNLNLSDSATREAIEQALAQISRNSPPVIQPLINNFQPELLAELSGHLSLLINEPEKPDNYPAEKTHLYLEVKDSQSTHSLFLKELKKMKMAMQNSKDLTQMLISSQIRITDIKDSILLELPVLPAFTATFNQLENVPYSVLSPNSTAFPAPILTQTPPLASMQWRYSATLLAAADRFLPQQLKNEVIIQLNSRNKLLFSDLLNFLASTDFFSLCSMPDYDNIKDKRIFLQSELKLRFIK